MAKKEKEKVEEIKDKEAKAQALKLALQRLEKSFGKGTVMRLGDKVAEKVEVIPSGSLGLDIAAPDFIASPISFCAFGAGAATSSSSSIMEG